MTFLRLSKTLLPAINLIAGLLLCGQSVFAQGKFSDALGLEDKISCGMTHITVQQQTVLDALIQRDVVAARQGNVTAFAKSFTQRRTEKECANSGVSTFTDAERARLDSIVATAIARRPMTQVYQETPSKALEGFGIPKAKPEIHGSMSLMYGQGSGGRSFYGGAMDVNYTDPSGKFMLAVGYSEIHGKGGCSPYSRYGRGYGYGSSFDPYYTGLLPTIP